MVLWKPGDHEVQPSPPALGADVAPPGRPSANQSSETELANDVRVRSVLDQPDGCPALVEATDRTFAGEQLPEALFIDVVVPHPGETLGGHGRRLADSSPRPSAIVATPRTRC